MTAAEEKTTVEAVKIEAETKLNETKTTVVVGEPENTTANTPKQLVPTVWKPGYCPNPAGRPKQLKELRETCRRYTPEILEKLMDVVRHSKNDNAIVNAGSKILAYGYGQPEARLIVDDQSGYTASILRNMTEEELKTIRGAYDAATQRLEAQKADAVDAEFSESQEGGEESIP